MQKWEYLTIELGRFGMMAPQQVAPRYVDGHELRDWKKLALHTYLSQLGQDGWEMCGTLTTESRLTEYIFFKRPR